MLKYQIRPMTLEDIQVVSELEKMCFPVPWSLESFRLEIERNKCAYYVVAVVEERVTGYGGMWVILDEAHVTNIAVHPDYRGMGMGKAIMKALMKKAASMGIYSMTLEVRVSNKIAQNLYRKLGFHEAGVRKQYYANNGEDALVMWNTDIRQYLKE